MASSVPSAIGAITQHDEALSNGSIMLDVEEAHTDSGVEDKALRELTTITYNYFSTDSPTNRPTRIGNVAGFRFYSYGGGRGSAPYLRPFMYIPGAPGHDGLRMLLETHNGKILLWAYGLFGLQPVEIRLVGNVLLDFPKRYLPELCEYYLDNTRKHTGKCAWVGIVLTTVARQVLFADIVKLTQYRRSSAPGVLLAGPPTSDEPVNDAELLALLDV